MTSHISFYLLLFLTGCCDCKLPGTISPALHRDATRYCHICPNHTMCRFPDHREGARCKNLLHADLNRQDIDMILLAHNIYRDTVASGEEQRGNPGPQRPAKYMMELVWDDELAHIANRWALQCNLFEQDQCRDVERFGVWQNVHVLDMDTVGKSTSAARIRFHIQSWYDQVEDFDSAEFGASWIAVTSHTCDKNRILTGAPLMIHNKPFHKYCDSKSFYLLVNFTARSNLSYIPFAAAEISQIGCGRAIYTAAADDSKPSNESGGGGRGFATGVAHTIPVEFGDRVETLVCNYGPLDRKTPGELYEDGVPGLCPPGTVRNPWLRYEGLCRKVPEWYYRTMAFKEHSKQTVTSGTLAIKRAVYLVQLVSLLLARLST